MKRLQADPSGLAVRIASLLALLLLWQIAATAAESRALPPPQTVLAFVLREAHGGDLFHNIVMTLARVAAAFALAMSVGTAIGVVMGRFARADRAFDTWLLVLLNMPALVITVLCYIWLGLTESAAILAVALNKIPNVVVILREGTRALDRGLDEMAFAYRFSRISWLRHVLVPQLAPYLAAAARSGLALVWKIVLLVELLGRPDGVGYAISTAFQLFDVAAVLGYALSFTVVMLLIEYLIIQPLDVHARRWRPAAP
jgi:ABC-type nitrate/sulfonate/bicarbonate transport system permease component